MLTNEPRALPLLSIAGRQTEDGSACGEGEDHGVRRHRARQHDGAALQYGCCSYTMIL